MVLRIWRTGIDESRAREYREFAVRESAPMFAAHDGFLGVMFAAAPRQRAVVTFWESPSAAAGLAESSSYRRTVDAIEAAGFLEGPSTVETFELQDVFLGESFWTHVPWSPAGTNDRDETMSDRQRG
jgi:heme-degrading monooxygenase HmoA